MIKRFGSDEGVLKTLDVVNICCHSNEDGIKIYLQALCVPLICSPLENPNLRYVKENYEYLEKLKLAQVDTSGGDSLKIDLLIGIDYYYTLITGKIIKGYPHEPVAVESIFGWIICANVGDNNLKDVHCNLIQTKESGFNSQLREETDDSIENLKRFWEIESVGINSPADVYEQFKNNISHDGKRYVAKLPLKPHCELLPDNYKLCLRRLNYLVNRLKKDKQLELEYNNILADYEKSGIIERVVNSGSPGRVHYLPHREVVRRDKTTTKVRIVFDASARGIGHSLNDCLYAGPCLIASILRILIRFRVYMLGLTADIQQAFLNVGIHEDYRDLLRFLWLVNEKVVSYRFAVAIFGAKCSSFLLNGTINHHMENYVDENLKMEENLSLIKKFLDSLYIDDLITGINSHEEGLKNYRFAKKALQAAGFNLRKWYSNSKKLTIDINKEEDVASGADEESTDDYSRDNRKVLGILWNTNDEFVFDFQEVVKEGLSVPVSKRNILSISAKFYDPLGLISPIIVFFKVLFQELCTNDVSWDKPVKDSIRIKWTAYLEDLRTVRHIKVPRFLCGNEIPDSHSIHGFCDSSSISYAAVVYMRCIGKNGVVVRLFSSKTKVAPIQAQTIPRLELLSCLLLAELVNVVKDAIQGYVEIEDTTLWTDSEIALAWIRGSTKEWKPWVENRVNKIRELTSITDWCHVPGTWNPADVPTREVNVRSFQTSKLWWEGPEFLLSAKSTWPKQNVLTLIDHPEIAKEMRKKPQMSTLCNNTIAQSSCSISVVERPNNPSIEEIIIPEHYSSLEKLLRITSYVTRFINNLKHSSTKISGHITVEEVESSKLLWIKNEQNYASSYKHIGNLKRQLGLFTENGIIRLRGRFKYLDWEDSKKYPVLLPRTSHFTKLLILKAHADVLHSGIIGTLNQLRNEYWICRGRQVVRSIIRKCVICKRVQGKPGKGPPPPDLPAYRLSSDFAFMKIGIDFAGALHVKNIYGDSNEMHKAYICLITCASTRNLHLELVPDLTAGALVRCLKRFMARRGTLHTVVSDNAKTFLSQELGTFIRAHNITWTYILAKSPWWGGFYERMVRIVKDGLRKSLGKARCTYEELETLLFEVEMVANSRPLTYLHDDVTEALTPSHLVIGRKLMGSAVRIQPVEDYSPNKRLHFLNHVLSSYWKHFHNEYLNQLREKHCYNNGKFEVNKLVVGDAVLIKDDDNYARNTWKRGVIDDLIKGNDGNIRGAKLRTYVNGTISMINRPVQKLVPLEITTDNSDVDYTKVVEESATNNEIDVNENSTDPAGNKSEDVNISEAVRKRPVRTAATMGELKRRYGKKYVQ